MQKEIKMSSEKKLNEKVVEVLDDDEDEEDEEEEEAPATFADLYAGKFAGEEGS